MPPIPCLLAVLLAFTMPAHAAEPLEIGASLGVFAYGKKDEALMIEVEARRALWDGAPLQGWGAAFVTGDGALFAGLGLGWPIDFFQRWRFTPLLSFGAYEPGDGRDLGSVLEFRTGMELAYRLEGNDRLAASFHHISNAGIGDRNPGANMLLVRWRRAVDGF